MSGGMSDEDAGEAPDEAALMKRAVMETGFRRARDARIALGGLLVLSMTANLALGIGLAGREAVTVMVPAVTGPAWEVGGGRAGARYLEDMARTAAVTLLTLTPENAAHVRRAAARLSPMPRRGARSAPESRPRPRGWRGAISPPRSTPRASRPTPGGSSSKSGASS